MDNLSRDIKAEHNLIPMLKLHDTSVVSVVGAGGKTSTIVRLAEEYESAGLRAIVMTTTHMRRPSLPNYIDTTNMDAEHFQTAIREMWESYSVVWIGNIVTDGKISGISEELQRVVLSAKSAVLIEADGAAGKPCKAPETYEPQILLDTTDVINVYGLRALGNPIRDVCHRPQPAAAILQKKQGDILTAEDIVTLGLSEKAGRKCCTENMRYHILLNQADAGDRKALGTDIKKRFEAAGFDGAHLMSAIGNYAIIVLAAGKSSRYQSNKLLAVRDEKPLYQHMLDNLRHFSNQKQVVVTRFPQIEEAAKKQGVTVVINEHPELGISHSLQLGLRKCIEEDPQIEGVLVSVCDQPNLTHHTMRMLLEKATSHPGKIICAGYLGLQGNPVVWDKRYFPELMEIAGDTGGKQVMKHYPYAILIVDTKEEELEDIDYQ